MILLVFGWMLIGCGFVSWGFAGEGWKRRQPFTPYNAGLCLAGGLLLFASGLGLSLRGRLEQLLFDRADLSIDDLTYWIGCAMMLAGETLLVWTSSLGEGRRYSRRFWGLYWSGMIAWAVFVMMRAIV